MDAPVRLALASSSPRRREILAGLGLRFKVRHAEVDESPRPGERVETAALRLAMEKAHKVAQGAPDALVIGADTLVALDGEMMGKPDDAPHAEEMLNKLNGKTHDVFTGVAFAAPGCQMGTLCASRVSFKNLSAREIADYIATGEPFGKAGAYAIQGEGRALIRSFEGSFTNIVGLPVRELLRFFVRFGMDRLPWEAR